MARADRIAIIGAAGMLGRELLHACAAEAGARGKGGERPSCEAGISPSPPLPLPPSLCLPFDLPDLDITNPDQVSRTLNEVRPDVVINAAAYTDVDACEQNQDLAESVNAAGPANLARACRDLGSRLIHISTDYVFDGRATRPYRPDDPVAPINVYGRTKQHGEQRVRETLPDHLIVRTSWLHAPHGKNFVNTILRLAAQKPELRVVDDQVGCPTYAADLADALLTLARSDARGTFHFCNAGVCSWYAFAREILRQAGLSTPVFPTTTADFPRPAPRPAYSVLDTSTFTQLTGQPPRPWQEALADSLRRMDPQPQR